MKSPWQFISDLAERRRKRLAEENSGSMAAVDPDLKSLTALPAPANRREDIATTVDPGNTSHQEAALPNESVLSEMQPTTQETHYYPIQDSKEADRPTSEVPETASVIQDGNLAKMPRLAGGTPDRAPRARRKLVQRPPVELQPSMPERPFYAEIISVDGDIKQLWSELSKKLRLQNEQLKKMLRRFEQT